MDKNKYKYRISVTPKQMKMLETESDKAGVSYKMLMENAGSILAHNLDSLINYNSKISNFKSKYEVIFLCGNGNNAGDCFVAARYLKEINIDSTIFLLCGEPKTKLAKHNFERIIDIPIVRDENEMLAILSARINNEPIYITVDGVFGTGFHGELPENIKRIFKACQEITVAVDVPSGGNCQTGAAAEGTPKAERTITFGCRKFGMTQYPLKSLCGDITIADIKIPDNVYEMIDYPVNIFDSELAALSIPIRKPDSHKGDFGRLVNVCGSINMPGASIMAALAAARCGVGLLTVCTPKEYVPHIAAKLPEAVFLPLDTADSGTYTSDSYQKIEKASEKATALLIGCGLGISSDSRELVKKLLININCPIILDADGINCITGCIDIIRQTKQQIILTPHPAEMARLCGVTASEVQSNRLEYAGNFAKKYDCIVILKGAGTIIAYPDKAYVCTTGNPGMSKGGSGDVLSGIIASFAAQSIPSEAGVYIHGAAGDSASEKHSMQSMLPTDIIDELGGIFKSYGK